MDIDTPSCTALIKMPLTSLMMGASEAANCSQRFVAATAFNFEIIGGFGNHGAEVIDLGDSPSLLVSSLKARKILASSSLMP